MSKPELIKKKLLRYFRLEKVLMFWSFHVLFCSYINQLYTHLNKNVSLRTKGMQEVCMLGSTVTNHKMADLLHSLLTL